MTCIEWRPFGLPLFSYVSWDGGVWFRVFYRGIHIKDTSKHPLLFSERNGHVPLLRLGKWSVRLLGRGMI